MFGSNFKRLAFPSDWSREQYINATKTSYNRQNRSYQNKMVDHIHLTRCTQLISLYSSEVLVKHWATACHCSAGWDLQYRKWMGESSRLLSSIKRRTTEAHGWGPHKTRLRYITLLDCVPLCRTKSNNIHRNFPGQYYQWNYYKILRAR